MARPSTISLVPPSVNLVLYAGDGANLRLTATDLEGEPFDLRGEVRAQIRQTRAAPQPLVEWEIEMAEAELGIVVLRLTGDDTRSLMDSLDRFRGVWDCVWTMADSQPVTLIQGEVTCDLDVTR